MFLTRDTFHFEISPLKDVAPMKMAPMFVMLDTSHSPIEQARSWVNFIQVVIALLSSALDFGENSNSPAQKFGEMKITRVKRIT